MSRLGPSFMRIWTGGSYPRSGSWNARTQIKNIKSSEKLLEFFWRNPNDFLSHRPKKFQEQKSAGKVLASIFWDQDGILLIDYLPKGQTINTEYYLSLLVRSPRQSCSCTTMPQLTGHLQPRRNWPTWASNVLITHPVLQIWPRWTTTCFWTEKTIERLPFLVRRRGHCCRRDLVGRTTFWISFEWLA